MDMVEDSIMWTLVFWISTFLYSPEQGFKLEEFPTKKECYDSLYSVQRDMNTAYANEPGPVLWRLSCQYKEVS
jgi:hypothetical protein